MEKVTVPRRAIRLNVLLQILAAAVLLGAVNFYSFNHYWRGDFSRSQKFVLADQTRRVLREINNPAKPLRITVVFSPTLQTPEVPIYGDVRNLLKELVFSGRKNQIRVEYVDQTRDPARARELQGKYQFTANENVVILDYEDRVRFVPVAEMADFDLTPMATGQAPRIVAFKGEQALTNAIIGLTNPERRKVYFLQGHGEPAVEGPSPVAVFKDYIERQNVRVAPLAFSSLDAIPADCAALVLLAPKTDLQDREAALLEKFWNEKGRLFVLLDPDAPVPRLRAFLTACGLTPADNRVLRIQRLPGAGGLTLILPEVTGVFLGDNTITKRMAGRQIFFDGFTQSLTFDVAKSRAAGVQIWPLIEAGEEFWGEADYRDREKTGVRYDDGRDDGYPVYLAAAASRGGVSDDRVEVDSAKLVVAGNAQFALDTSLRQEGLDFLLSATNWLLDRGRLTGVTPKVVQHFTLNLSDRQLGTLALYTMVVIPGIAALCGLVAWIRRRA
jgi:hypothetical protein